MTQYLKGDALSLDSNALPSVGSDGEVRFDGTDLKKWSDALGAWVTLGGSGGGGSSVDWHGASGSAPTPDEEFGQMVWKFATGNTNLLTAFVKVPDGYNAGSQINIRIAFYTPSTSNTVQLETIGYLVRKNADAIDSVANAHSSTNTDLLNSGTANKYREQEVDITDSAGLVGGLAVSAGDIIRVLLSRGTDTDTENIRFIPTATELTI